MDRTLQLVSKTSNEIFMLRFPRSVLNFCDYDLAYFAENAIAAGNDALKNGEADSDRITDLRNSIKDAHVYIEHHLRTTYDKIVLDCWIDYVCRRDNVGTASLWNRFAGCKSAFERDVFTRLCDFRYNRAINEWLNLVRVQDYARNKISFVFSKALSGADEAAARRNYFDLMFSVTAQELGCRTDELGVTKVFTLGRLPSAPFMFPTISKDIIKNLLSDLDYSEDYSDGDYSGELSDQIAMDAFAHMKHGLAQEFDSYNISRSQMENASPRVYMPCGLKAAVDLEIDALIESGGWLARCKRCGRYFLRDSEHMQEYCSLKNPGGKTCLEIYELEHPASLLTPELERGCREVTDIMYARIDKDMSLSEYESWKVYLDALADKVKNGEIPPDELREFLRYSQSVDLSRSNPVIEVPKKEPQSPKERVVKPFVPERIQRSDISAPKKQEDDDPAERAARREGFFTSPSVQRQKSERSPISHIIRAGEKSAEPSGEGFVGFAESEARRRSESVPAREEERSVSEPVRKQQAPERFAEKPFAGNAAPERFAEKPFAGNAAPERFAEKPFAGNAAPERTAEKPFAGNTAPERFAEKPFAGNAAPERTAESEPVRTRLPEQSVEGASTDVGAAASVQPEAQPAPRPRVIKKNAAAISAYGKMSGTPAAPQLEQVSRPEPAPAKREESAPDPDPFRDVGSIFDVLEQSDSDMSDLIPYEETPKQSARKSAPKIAAAEPAPAEKRADKPARKPHAAAEPAPEWETSAKPAAKPAEKSAPESAEPETPSGFWTEERHLFPENDEESSELAMLKEKKRGRSSKTRHLYEALMKEPEDNPTFRKKR